MYIVENHVKQAGKERISFIVQITKLVSVKRSHLQAFQLIFSQNCLLILFYMIYNLVNMDIIIFI